MEVTFEPTALDCLVSFGYRGFPCPGQAPGFGDGWEAKARGAATGLKNAAG